MIPMFRKQLSILGMLCFSVPAAHAASVQVLSATVKDQAIAGATVILQKNGAASAATQTDAQGKVTLPTGYTDDASTLLLIKKDGYSTLVAKCPCEGLTYALSPVMKNLDGMRVVLTWGAEPQDLDSHISYPGNHIFWNSKNGTDGKLDVDDRDGFGPETITLTKKHEGETYVYSVHDYSDVNAPGTDALSKSEAKVFVYVGQSLVRTYYVPTGKKGNLWTVFRITGEGEFQDINSIRGVNANPATIGSEVASYGNDATRVVAENRTSDTVRAKAKNVAGEKAYREGRLDDAISLFQEATELDGSYGQAYGNLGLVYQKAGRSAEAIWANRKALALASGPNAATIRAGAYYNIGRIYEDANELSEALTAYMAARAEKANPVYDNAVERLNPHH